MGKKSFKFMGIPILQNEKRLIIDITYIAPEILKKLEEFIGDEKIMCTGELRKSSASETRSYEQLKAWWMVVEDILTFLREPCTKENKNAMSESLKKYLPTRYVRLNGKDYKLPKSIADRAEVPMEDFSEALNDIMADWREQGCFFRLDNAENWGKA